MSFKVVVTDGQGRTAVINQAQLNLLPALLRFTPRKKLDAAIIAACIKHGCPIDFEAQAETK